MYFAVLIFVGYHISTVAYWNSKTHGEGFSSIRLTIFELWPKNCNFLWFLEKQWKIQFFPGYYFNTVSPIELNPKSIGIRIQIHNSGYIKTLKNPTCKIQISDCYVKTLLVIQGQVVSQITIYHPKLVVGH